MTLGLIPLTLEDRMPLFAKSKTLGPLVYILFNNTSRGDLFPFISLGFWQAFWKFSFGNRQRSLHRTLQGLEKQLEHNNRACQHMAKLQTDRVERSRKESSLREEEKRKERQRLQFLKAQRLQREELQAEYNQRNYDQDKKRQVRATSLMPSWTLPSPHWHQPIV